MKHEILPASWCVANCKSVIDYINGIAKEGSYEGTTKYYGVVEGRGDYSNENPFGQLLTEEQFLYCIGEPTKGEEIEVSNIGFINGAATNAFALKLDENEAWATINISDTVAYHYLDYRRKPLVFEVDKWAKEKAAFAEGKTIQYLKEESGWADILHIPLWSSCDEYRIKPEPKYAPFTREDWDLFKMKEVMFDAKIESTSIGIIIGCDSDGVIVSREYFSYEYMFENALFIEGSPFGKLIKE